MRSVIFMLCVASVWSYSQFQDRIPNGESVPHPCKANYLWRGVGHLNPLGGGAKNQFGEDFKDAGYQWTKNLCEMDSDGDGKTNGQELGDPNCNWESGEVPDATTDLSHPGVCTPHSSSSCQSVNSWINCEIGQFQCEAVNEIGMKNLTVRFPMTTVPPTETNYYCMMFDLPKDADYHMVATAPYIDNADVMHHILLFGCDEREYEITNYPLNLPQPCGMGIHPQCSSLVGLWAVGQTGECSHKNVGFKLGRSGFTKAVFQFHWNNPELRSDYMDSSGMTIYYTPNRRVYDANILMIGQEHLQIPPGREAVTVEGWCDKECTNGYQLTGPIYITRALNHMHYLGRQQSIEQYRNGIKIRDITYDEVYSYDSPVVYQFDDPIEVLPGDEFKTTCTFKSVGKASTTLQGEGTSNEMCYGFLTYYPAENMPNPYCTAWKTLPMCKVFAKPYYPVINGCNWVNFENFSHPDTVQLFKDVFSHCSVSKGCLPECKSYVSNVLNSNACLRGDVGDYFRLYADASVDIMRFWMALDSCNADIEQDACNDRCNSQTPPNNCYIGV